MPDRLTPTQRHRCMSHIHSRDTKPELLVRRWLWSHGYRYRLNQERDKQNYQILQENGWHVIVIWECQLKPNSIKETMLKVETMLCNYFLALHRPKVISYTTTEDTELPMAAEDSEDYGR